MMVLYCSLTAETSNTLPDPLSHPGRKKHIGMVVEGAHAIRVVHQLATEMNIDMPITKACYQVLYEGQNPRAGVEKLMKRSKKHEIEEIASPNIDW